jgi:hypothetical protein
MARDSLSLMVFVNTYWSFLKLLDEGEQQVGWKYKFLSAGLAGVAGSAVAQPFEVIKQGVFANAMQKVSVFNNFQIFKGLKKLFIRSDKRMALRSFLLNSPQVFLSTGVLFYVWELCQNSIRFV